MRANLLRAADAIRASYWFFPSIMALGSILLAGGMIWLETHVGSRWMDALPWLYAARPDGARQVLSAIAGSMITVAGTVFSVTIASVVFASGQYGPRLLTNFMSDRGNQVTLGTFIATFVYCLLILRTVRSADENGGAGFVPNLALLLGVGLALCSIAVLIFFIHHVPSKLHINSVIQAVGARLIQDIDHRFPRFIGEPPDPEEPAATRPLPDGQPPGESSPVRSQATGYVQLIDEGALMACARDRDLVIRLQHQPGDFVHVGRTLAQAWPAARCDDEAIAAIRAAFAFGTHRTALQDLRFLIDELVEIAARALSPGVNDPFTAITCLDWLGAALSDLAQREVPSALRMDDDGELRIVAFPVTFESFLERSFGALAQRCAADAMVALRFIQALGEIALACERPASLGIIGSYAERLEEIAAASLHGDNLARVQAQARELRRALESPDHRRLRDSAVAQGKEPAHG